MAADSMPRSDSSSLDEKMSKSDVNGIADEALNSEKHVAEDTAEATTQYTEEQYAALVRRFDRFLLPIMWICYGVQQADKTGLSTQVCIKEDTHLRGQQYSWLSTIFYISYLCCEFPSNWVMQRINIGRTLSVLMLIWGVIVLCTAFAENWAHLMVLRTLQGAAECTISPAFLLIVGAFYTRREHTLRALIWGTANAGFGIITDLCMYFIAKHAQEAGGLAPWKAISFFLGGMTIVLSFFAFFLLGTPREVLWLSPEQKRMAAARVAANKTGSDRLKRYWNTSQALSVFRDPQTIFFFVVNFVNNLPNGGTTSFGNLVYVSFGFSNLEVLVKGNIPRSAFSIVFFLFVGWVNLKWTGLRFWIMMASVVPSLVGMLATALLPDDPSIRWTKWGMYFMTVTGNVSGPLMWTMVPSNVAGRTKKTVMSSIMFVAYCVGNAIGAQIFRAEDAPRYVPAIISCGVLYCVQFVLMFLWRYYYVWENRRRDRAAEAAGISPEERERLGMINAENDMTDVENVQCVSPPFLPSAMRCEERACGRRCGL
ncbi:major facilitator superfamily domain-containing protein [Schizophyllum commune]